jgi:hypothetical protein
MPFNTSMTGAVVDHLAQGCRPLSLTREERATGNAAQYQASVFNFARTWDQFDLISILTRRRCDAMRPSHRVDFPNERQAMTSTFPDIDDIGGTPHLVENRFRLNGAAAVFEIIHTQEFPVRQFGGKQKNSVFCIRRHFHSC